MTTNTQSIQFFYCYSKNLSDYLTAQRIPKVTVAREPKSNRLFSLYIISNELQEAIDSYKNTNK